MRYEPGFAEALIELAVAATDLLWDGPRLRSAVNQGANVLLRMVRTRHIDRSWSTPD
jgi:hypothetical protein